MFMLIDVYVDLADKKEIILINSLLNYVWKNIEISQSHIRNQNVK